MTEQHKYPTVEEAVKCASIYYGEFNGEHDRAFSVLKESIHEQEDNLAVRGALALYYYADDNHEKLKLYEEAAEDGLALAQVAMARSHEGMTEEMGLAERSLWKSKEFYEKAAAQGHPWAMFSQTLNDLGGYENQLKKEKGILPELNPERAYKTGKKLIDLDSQYADDMLDILIQDTSLKGLFDACVQGDEREIKRGIATLRLMEFFAQKQLNEMRAENNLNNGDPGAPAPGNDI